MKTLIGKIIKTNSQGMAVVQIARFMAHPLYKKRMRKTTKLHAVYTDKVSVGDRVKIGECKPLSKTISWQVISKLDKK